MTESNWTKYIRKALINKGKNLRYETNKSNKNIHIKNSEPIRPDIVWKKDDKIKIVFEIDTGARDIYPKTIYGSMITGILLAKQKNCKFVEVTPKGSNGKKATSLLKLINSQFQKVPKSYVVQIGRLSGKDSEKNIQKSLTKELKKIRLIPKKKGY